MVLLVHEAESSALRGDTAHVLAVQQHLAGTERRVACDRLE
jgi:hypothetical protein